MFEERAQGVGFEALERVRGVGRHGGRKLGAARDGEDALRYLVFNHAQPVGRDVAYKLVDGPCEHAVNR